MTVVATVDEGEVAGSPNTTIWVRSPYLFEDILLLAMAADMLRKALKAVSPAVKWQRGLNIPNFALTINTYQLYFL